MADRDELGDHAPHRRPDDVDPVEAECVDKAGGVVGEVLEPVRGEGPNGLEVTTGCGTDQLTEVDGELVELRRQAGVSVVEPDHEPATPGEPVAEAAVPGEHLRAEPGDQQDRGVGRVAERLVLEVDVARNSCLWHRASFRSAWERSGPPSDTQDGSWDLPRTTIPERRAGAPWPAHLGVAASDSRRRLVARPGSRDIRSRRRTFGSGCRTRAFSTFLASARRFAREPAMGNGSNSTGAAGGGALYGLGILGAWVFFWQQADSFWAYVLVVFQGLFWPAWMVYDVFGAAQALTPSPTAGPG